ncbi:hypothetical protein D6825_03085, partial [Candidatus Woesearchaeota archaeon]
MRRAQVTVFIILGLVILLIVGVVLYLNSRQAQEPYAVQKGQLPERALIVNRVEGCLRSAAQ